MSAKPVEPCAVCQRDPKRMNSAVAECSHVDCPHRRACEGGWGSERGWMGEPPGFAPLDLLDDPDAP